MKKINARKIIKFLDKKYNKIFLIVFVLYAVYILSAFTSFKNQYPFFDASCANTPITQYDYSFHFTESIYATESFKNNYRIWRYNPYHFAGYPGGIFLNISNHWTFLFQLILGNLFNPFLIFNLSIFVALLILPLLAFFTARNFKHGRINSLFFFVLSILFVIGFKNLREMFRYGLYAFPLAVFLSFYTSSLFFNYIHEKRKNVLFKLIFFGSLAFFVHPLSAVICLILCLPISILYFNKFSLKDFYKITVSLIIIIAANILWLVPYLRFLGLADRWDYYLQTNDNYIFTYIFKYNQLFFLIVILFLFFIYKSFKNKDYKLMLSFLISYFLFAIVSFLGTQIGVGGIQPARFIVPLSLLGILAFSKLVKKETKSKNYLFFILIILYLLFSLQAIQQSPFKMRFKCGEYLNSDIPRVFNFIDKNTTRGTRLQIQVETYPPERIYFKPFVPYFTHKEILSGPYHTVTTKFVFVQYKNDKVFGKNLSNISPYLLRKYSELYNIKYFLVSSEESHKFFDENKDFKKTATFGPFSFYEYLYSDESFCYKCYATVMADYDKITVENATSNVTILKYHYIKTLKVKPEHLKIRPIKIMDDPVPFILVENRNISNFMVYNP